MSATTTTKQPVMQSTKTTITSDPGILCFHHCNVKVFCFTLPSICPGCKLELYGTSRRNQATAMANAGENNEDVKDAEAENVGMTRSGNGNGNIIVSTKLLPFRLPFPFVRASQYPCAIVLRPTTGDFLNDYNNSRDLHIAVTTSTGSIVEFDRFGLQQQRNANEWRQSLLLGDVPEPWYDYWDDVLLQICNKPGRWSMEAYHVDTHNCYTFVLDFLQALAYGQLSAAAISKTVFCEKFIVPRTIVAGKYISLYRKLRDAGVYVQLQHQHSTQQFTPVKVRATSAQSRAIATRTTKTPHIITTHFAPSSSKNLFTIQE